MNGKPYPVRDECHERNELPRRNLISIEQRRLPEFAFRYVPGYWQRQLDKFGSQQRRSSFTRREIWPDHYPNPDYPVYLLGGER